MLKTLRISFSLKNTYRVNSILFGLKQIPVLKRLMPGTIYQMPGFKLFGNIISVVWELITAFIGKFLYFYLMLVLPIGMYQPEGVEKTELFFHIFIFLTAIGTFVNTYMFNPSKDKYYALVLLGVNAKRYTLVEYFYALIKVIIGFGLFALLFRSELGLSIWQCLLLPFFVVGSKLVFAAYDLWKYEKKGISTSESKLGKLFGIVMLGLLAGAYGLPFLEAVLPVWLSGIIMLTGILAGMIALRKIVVFRFYRELYREILVDAMNMMNSVSQGTLVKEQSHKNISADTAITSKRKGFEYLNELFIKRHQKILWKSSKKLAVAALVIAAAGCVILQLFPEFKSSINDMLMSFLQYFVFIMYVINRGTGFTEALFINCDHSLLTYSFYKRPKFILKLFQIRLWEITKINLLPAVIIGGGLDALLYVSGGTDNPLNYVVVFVSIIALSVFFSVHYLTIYYLLQPYNAGTEIKSGMYKFIMWITYVVCYVMLQIKLPTLFFGAVTIVFCVLYCVIASVLVYFLAHKTFKIRV